MSFLKKGPEIKLSDLKLSRIKVPTLIQDVYFDLKERHLLPVAAVLVVALVAVPIALGQSSSSPEPAEMPAIASGATAAGGSNQQLVARSTPGLRDYRKRLQGLHPKNPFKQQYTAKEGEGTGSSSTSAETGGGESSEPASKSTEATPTETSGGSGVPTTEGESGGEGESEPNPSHLRYYSYAIDVRVSAAGSQGGGQSEGTSQTGSKPTPKSPNAQPPQHWTTRHNLPELTMLPSRKVPAVIYMGSTKDAKKALMLVSSDVTSIFGDAKCVLGSKTCELLALEPGVPEIFVYGPQGRTFKIELIKVHLVESKKLNRAPLGKPKRNGHG